MKRIYDVVGLLVLSALVVNANPFYPYGDKEEEEQKNAFVSDEAVAAYFKNKFETENVQPAMIMEYLINLMGASKKKPSSGSNSEYLF